MSLMSLVWKMLTSDSTLWGQWEDSEVMYVE